MLIYVLLSAGVD